ncbi:uncharacterized protein FOMMEDRAFT_141077 [Fomitiporia mediterranea MF3/22]|uniref:uncharacterized protein n=1 Tax=Fomitiporia mediterranea (strain MF3/22) TaxID=694068 RepID=UPI000440790D|nr:uncharacterized protein FOMMEDRAFT_141077 [Fomitiporia mediterranea MF3/22]EJD01823.1 hypothetical protein FOMMEDRAFT_141077 [Fomitiporia mediterranea MF3/22]
MTPMPAPLPWSGGSSVPSHANNTHTHGLQLPPPVSRFAGAPHLTRGFAYPLNATTSGRQDGAEGDGNLDKGKTAGLNGGAGMIPKREEEGDTHLSTGMYSAVAGDSPYAPRHAPGRHQQHESLHSISPTSATAPSPALTFSAASRQHHPQLPSPHTHQQNYHEHSQQTVQRGMAGSSSHQQQSQSHYHNPQHHQHQQGGTTLPSPHSPYSPVGPAVPFRGYEEERYHPEAHHQHHQAGPQNQSQNQDYLWQTGTVYGN